MTTKCNPQLKKLPLAACAMSLAFTGTALAQNFPNRPIHVYTSDIGGGTDIVARIVGQIISGPLGQQVVVENKNGGVIAPDTVAHAAPDGYSLLFFGTSLWLIEYLRSQVPFNYAADLVPVALGTRMPGVLMVHPSVPVKSVSELIALAKAKPGTLNYATASTGTSNHLAAELFKYMTGVNMIRVPYKGGGAVVNAVIAGETQLMFPAIGSVTQYIKTDCLRALAVTGAKRSVAFPELPTIAESGLPGYESLATIGMFAPAKTPPAIVTRLNREVNAVFERADIKERLLKEGQEVSPGTPAQFGAIVDEERRSMGKMIKDTGIRDE